MRKIGEKEIKDMAVGAAVLGTGGGGDPYVGKLMAIQAVREYGEVTLLDPEEVPDDELVVPSSMMGAPTVSVEKIPNGEEPFFSFNVLEQLLGKKIYATMSIEAGGVNSMIPIALAARKGIPLVDADTMGRAFPELQMTTFHLHGIHGTPLSMCDEKGNSLILNTVSNKWTEELARASTVIMGGSSILADYAVTGRQLKEAGVLGTATKCEKIGRAIREAAREKKNPIQAVLEVTDGFLLFNGKIMDVERKTDGAFVHGKAVIEGLGDNKDEYATVYFQNENIVARKGDIILATAPDLIVLLDKETARPVTTERIKYGARVVMIGIPCDPQWRSEKGIETVGPRYFGYEIDYIPIEARMRKERSHEKLEDRN